MKAICRTIAALVLSHTLAAGIGGVVARFSFRNTSEHIDYFTRGIARSPVSDAAHLAFRFSPPEHAEVLLKILPIQDSNDLFEWGETLMRDLRLAVVYKELGDANAEEAALASAVEACRLLGKKGCSLESARGAATKIGEYRSP